jgi:acetylserotonin N-methyltransferase
LTQTYQGTVVAADEAGIFTALESAPAGISELATRLGFDLRATSVFVRLLAALGLLVPREDRFHLTDQARTYLLPSSPFYWGPMMRVGVSEWHYSTALAALKKKESASVTRPDGTPVVSGTGRSSDGWAEGKISPEDARQIAARMHAHSLAPAIACARNYDFTGVRRLLDVGGGSGCFSIAMARMYPDLRCTIMELPTMCDAAQMYIKEGGVANRVDTMQVDMFRDRWPEGYEAVFFSNIWHDWNFRTCSRLAERSYEALPPGGRILLHEMLLDEDGAGPTAAASFSMLMLLATQGQQFTLDELKRILENTGFADVLTRPTSTYYSVTAAYKPK